MFLCSVTPETQHQLSCKKLWAVATSFNQREQMSSFWWGNPKRLCIIPAWCQLLEEARWWNGGLVWAQSLWNLWRPESQTHPGPACSSEQTWKRNRKQEVISRRLLPIQNSPNNQLVLTTYDNDLGFAACSGDPVLPALCQAQQELPVCGPEVLHFHHSLFNIDLSSLKQIFVLGIFTHASTFTSM